MRRGGGEEAESHWLFLRSPFIRERSRTPNRDRDRVSSERKISSRSYRSRSRSRSRSPKRSKRKEFTMQDTSLFAEMRKKKHLRDKLEARKSTKRDEYDDHSVNPEGRKSSSSSEKGKSDEFPRKLVLSID